MSEEVVLVGGGGWRVSIGERDVGMAGWREGVREEVEGKGWG